MTTTATARPWVYSAIPLHNGAQRTINIGVDSCYWKVGSFSCILPNDPTDDERREQEHIANAALIVRAVNSHQALVDALTRMLFLHGPRNLEEREAEALAKHALALLAEPQ